MLTRILLSLGFAIAAVAGVAGAQVEHLPPMIDSATVTVIHASPTPSPSPSPSASAHYDSGLPFNVVVVRIVHVDGSVDVAVSHNYRVAAGASAIAQLIGSAAGTPFNYTAVSADTTAVANGDTTCPSEITTGGLARKAGSYGSYTAPGTLGGSASFVQTTTWTATASASVNKICELNASSGGTLGFEVLLGSTKSVSNGDTLTVTWTFNL